MRRLLSRAAWLSLGLSVFVLSERAGAQGQQTVPAFRAGVDLLTLDATVLDRAGEPVPDLQAADFTVSVGGRPRKVVFAQFHGDRTVTSGSVSINAPGTPRTGAPAGDGRIVVFVVDRDSLAPGNEAALLETASSVLDSLGPADAVGLVGVPVGLVDLTRDHARVRAALPLMTGTRPRQEMYRDRNISWDEALAYERRDPRVIAEVVERECYNIPSGMPNRCPPDLVLQAQELLRTGRAHVLSTTSVLDRLAGQLAPLRGPKHVILISGGLAFGQDLLVHFERFAKTAAAARLVLYAVHLDQPDSDVTSRRTIASAFGGREMTAGLGALTGMTGGALFMGVGRAAGVFDRIKTEINNFYVLGVESEPDDAVGTPRALKVAVTRPGLSVRARREVSPLSVPPVATVADRLAALLNQPTDIGELSPGVTTYSTRGTEASSLRVLISCEFAAEGLRLPVDWAFSVLSEGNVVATGSERIEAGISEHAGMTVAAKLLPGRYRLRVAATDATGRVGVTDLPMVVGLRAAGSLQMSDLLVGVADDNGRLSPRGRIPQGTPVSALLEVMAGDPAQLEQVRAVIEVLPAGSAEPLRRFLMAARTGSADTMLMNDAEIATADLPAGRYSASVVILQGDQPVGRVSRAFEVIEK